MNRHKMNNIVNTEVIITLSSLGVLDYCWICYVVSNLYKYLVTLTIFFPDISLHDDRYIDIK